MKHAELTDLLARHGIPCGELYRGRYLAQAPVRVLKREREQRVSGHTLRWDVSPAKNAVRLLMDPKPEVKKPVTARRLAEVFVMNVASCRWQHGGHTLVFGPDFFHGLAPSLRVYPPGRLSARTCVRLTDPLVVAAAGALRDGDMPLEAMLDLLVDRGFVASASPFRIKESEP